MKKKICLALDKDHRWFGAFSCPWMNLETKECNFMFPERNSCPALKIEEGER